MAIFIMEPMAVRVLANMCFMLNSEYIVIGGGLSYAGKILFDPLVESYHNSVLPRIAESTSIVAAKLGNRAGIAGAAWLIRHSSQIPE
jgi:glucokinase